MTNGNHHNTRDRTITKPLVYLLATMCKVLSRTDQELRLTQTALSERNLARRTATVAGMRAKVNITFTRSPRHTTWHNTQP